MGLPTLQMVKEEIANGFNKKYQERIKEVHIEAVYAAVEKIWRRENDVTEESKTDAGNIGRRIPKDGGIRSRKIPQKKQTTVK